jgi:hypothetical protein
MLLRIWSDRMDSEQLEDIADEMQMLHKSMKNMMEIVFATSPLLALSTSGWGSKSVHSTYLLRVSDDLVILWVAINHQKDIPCPG